MKKLLLFLKLVLAIIILGCDQNRVFENVNRLPAEGWLYNDPQEFEIPVNEEGPFHLSVALRNSIEYQYYNIFLQYQLFSPGGKLLKSSVLEANLMNPKNGSPYGNEMEATGQGGALYYSHLLPLVENQRFDEKGNYSLRINHYMRPDTLQNIIAIGVILDRVPVN